ncbi:XRE family transcriptional regulator [Agarivorans sp. QJM3NY_29]|uniref:XRE family transcriptional regulator n=1 Tax=unclassified Agarivorans TaxID=2636026 RepID=UPI003D7EDEA6
MLNDKIKNNIIKVIDKTYRTNNLTQNQLSFIIGISQPRTSMLLSRKTKHFKIDVLLKMLENMGGYISKNKSSSITQEILIDETILKAKIEQAKHEHPRTKRKSA